MKNIYRKIIIIIFVFAVTAFAQSNADNVVKELQLKFDQIKDLSVNFMQLANGKSKLAGILYIKKENMLKIKAGNLLIVTDGKTAWNYNKAEKKVIISNYDENEPSVFSINELVYEMPAESDIELSNDKGLRVLTLTPNSYEYNFESIKLWLGEDNLITKIVLNDSAFGNTEVEFSNYRLNQNLNDSDFSFIPPEGSRIIDIR